MSAMSFSQDNLFIQKLVPQNNDIFSNVCNADFGQNDAI